MMDRLRRRRRQKGREQGFNEQGRYCVCYESEDCGVDISSELSLCKDAPRQQRTRRTWSKEIKWGRPLPSAVIDLVEIDRYLHQRVDTYHVQ